MLNKDVIIERLMEQNQQQADQIQLLTDEKQQLREHIKLLEEKIARLEKNSSNSSKPPSSDIINPKPENKKKRKRKIGGQKGHPKHRRPLFKASEIDKTIIHKLSAKEIRKEGLFSNRMAALTGYLKARCHMSYSTVQSFFDDIMGFDVSESYLTKVCTKKLSSALQLAYAEVGQFIRNAPVVGTDETGHKNPAYKSAWTWCQQTPGAVFFHISNSRASQVLIDILGKDYSGVITCDYFSANKKFIRLSNALVQYCWAHLIRDIKFLLTLGHKTLNRWSQDLLDLLQKIFKLWKTRHSRHFGRYKKSISKLKKAFLQKFADRRIITKP